MNRKNVTDFNEIFVPSKFSAFQEDFIASDSADRVTATGSGTVAILANQLNGVLQIDTETGVDQDTSIAFGETVLAAGKLPYLEARIRVGTALGTGIYKVGIVKDSDELAQLHIAADGDIHVTVDGGTADPVSAVDTGEDAVADTWYTVGILIREDGSVVFYLDGAELYKTEANVAAVSTTAAYDIFLGIEDTSAAQHFLDIDYIRVSQKR